MFVLYVFWGRRSFILIRYAVILAWFCPCPRGWFWLILYFLWETSTWHLDSCPPPPPSPRRHVVWRDSAGVGSSRSGLKSECPDIFHQSFLWLLRHTEVPTRVACSRLRDSSESEKSFKNKYSCLWLQSCSVLSSFGVDVLRSSFSRSTISIAEFNMSIKVYMHAS